MTFAEYKDSLACLTVSHLSHDERVRDAYRVGASSNGADTLSSTPPSTLTAAGPGYLWTKIERAFELGREAGRGRRQAAI